MRIAVWPCHSVPPHQHVPSRCTRSITSRVRAESPKETWLRLLLIRAGYPRPHTQIPLLGPDGYPLYRLDMGWEDKLIAVEYDGDDHREKCRWRKDVIRSEYIAHLRWKHIRVVAGEREADILRRVQRAWLST